MQSVAEALDRLSGLAASPTVATLADAFDAAGYELSLVGGALEATGVTTSPAQWKRINARYRKMCADAGSIPFFSLGRDDACSAAAQVLARIAARDGHRFREVGWRG